VRWAAPSLAALLLAGCGGAAKQADGTHPVGRIVHAPLCYPVRLLKRPRPCPSPDRRWTAQLERGPGRLVLTRLATGRQSVEYSSRDACCSDIAWVRPHLLAFADDYRAFILDPLTGKSTFVAGFSDFYASPDRAWIAGYAFAPPSEPQPAGVVSLATRKCVALPGSGDYIGSEFGFSGDTPRTGFSGDDKYVAVATPAGRVRFRISELRQPCASFLTRQP
jgi:hypothetical protein